jgi:hypothetical protein
LVCDKILDTTISVSHHLVISDYHVVISDYIMLRASVVSKIFRSVVSKILSVWLVWFGGLFF